VDLNRNCLVTETEWAEVLGRDPNFAHYADFSHVMNPVESPGPWDGLFFVFTAVYNIAQHGYMKLMRALVAGNYHMPEGIFYGGTELQSSHVLLHQWLHDQGYISAVRHMVAVDVHTGLGPMGVDTLLNEPFPHVSAQVFSGEWFPGAKVETTQDDPEDVEASDTGSAAYSDTRGLQDHCLVQLWDNLTTPPLVITQEFGTVPGVLVFFGVRKENAAFQHGTVEDQAEASKLSRSVFYVRNKLFYNNVVKRGKTLFSQALTVFPKLEAATPVGAAAVKPAVVVATSDTEKTAVAAEPEVKTEL
jgi:hypothetical protein